MTYLYALLCRWFTRRDRIRCQPPSAARLAFARPWPTTRRGFKLWLISCVLLARGAVYAVEPTTRSSALQFPVDWITPQVWGVIVVAVCSVSVFSSYCHFGRDRLGYRLMTFLAWIWAFTYGYGLVFRDAPEAAVQGGLSFVLIAVLVMHCAGDPEAPAPARARRTGVRR